MSALARMAVPDSPTTPPATQAHLRRQLGDTLLRRREAFCAIHESVAVVFNAFARAHRASFRRRRTPPAVALAEQNRALNVLERARREKVLTPGRDAESLVAAVQAHCDGVAVDFPIDASASSFTSLVAALDRLVSTCVLERTHDEPTLLWEAACARDALVRRLRADETRRREVANATRDWDIAFASLVDVTRAFLRLDGRATDLPALFSTRPDVLPPTSRDTWSDDFDAGVDGRADAKADANQCATAVTRRAFSTTRIHTQPANDGDEELC